MTADDSATAPPGWARPDGLRPPVRRPGGAIPASGAWTADRPAGQRRFITFATERPFVLEGGGRLRDITIAYETWGTLDADAGNAVLVCHALTGDAHAAGDLGPGHPTEGWWDDMIGPGRPLDTNRYFVVCANVLGGCQGSTGPASPHPDDGRPYGSRFPIVSVRDMVRTQAVLADRLGIKAWLSVIGGSMGGMQVIEWAVMYPQRVRSIGCIASAATASPLQIAWSEVGRLAIVLDPRWQGGDYYDGLPGDGPHEGLALARRIAQIHYRSDASFHQRFDRAIVEPWHGFNLWDRFQVESYLDHHGEKLVRRFDANSYLVLNKAMDLHDIGRGRGGLDVALSRITCPTLVVSIDSDMLYTPRQQQELRDGLQAQGKDVEYLVLRSDHGHDGFLLEFDQLGPAVGAFVAERLKDRG